MAHQRIIKANIQTTRPENDFELIQKIGSGTYGDVFKANVKATGGLAAVKIIDMVPDDDFNIIQQEIIIMEGCNHANIVRYLGSYLRKNKLWIAMELCGGGSLQDIYRVTGGLTEPMISFTCSEMLKGLQYMHAQLKLHRDIKGANVLLTVHGDVKLADFGVGAQINNTIGKRSTFIGTPYWMAPEVASVGKNGHYDHLCDIWAVGITAIELAECQPPLFDLHPMKALRVIAKRNYTPPTLNTKGKVKWSNDFKDFLKQCLTKSPKKRLDSGRLLNHAFCSGGTKRHLQELLEKYEQLRKGKHDACEYVSDDEDENNGAVELKPSLTVKRIQSRKQPAKVPIRPDRKPPGDIQKPADDNVLSPVREVVITDTGTIKFNDDCAPNTEDDHGVTERYTETIKFKEPPVPQFKAPPPQRPARPASRPPPPPPPNKPPPSVPPPPHKPTSTAPPHKPISTVPPKIPPPVPPRRISAEMKQQDGTLTDASFVDPPPIPARLGGSREKPVVKKNIGRPESALFEAKATNNYFTKIFNECPLNILHAACWEQAETKCKYLLFASSEGIYSLRLTDSADVEMIQIFSRSCKWVYVLKNMLVSICGRDSNVYMHNLVTLHGVEAHAPSTRGVAYTTKIGATANTLKCCVAHNPYNNEIYLYVGRSDGILMLQWYDPLQKFMNLKDIQCQLSPQLTMFQPIVGKGAGNMSVCVGVYRTESGDFILDKIGVETDTSWKENPENRQIDVKSLSQLEPNLILIAYDKTVRFIDINGKGLTYNEVHTELHFDYNIQDVICLPGSVLTFNRNGVQGKALQGNVQTAYHQDESRMFGLLSSDKIVLIKSMNIESSTEKPTTDLYILANESSP